MLSGGQRQRIAIARAFARDSSSSTGAGSSSATATRSLSRWGTVRTRLKQLQRADDLGGHRIGARCEVGAGVWGTRRTIYAAGAETSAAGWLESRPARRPKHR